MGNTNEQEEAIFQAAREFTDPGRRQAYIAGACSHNPELGRRVEALFAAQADEDKFFAQGLAAVVNSTAIVAPVAEKTGQMIGRYKLLQKIGEGGCGVVYMAEQEEPVRRRVALKIIKLGMDTKSVIARFETERQALALMDHPNIAKVHDAGATETGRPYFVMELVRGVKITDYCDEKNLTTRERLELFSQVCHAVQHAHQKGIIHRDLKPSNILVNMVDGVPVPKVIDFGIAKATNDQRLTDKTVFTAFEQFIGTPAYMSPEQAEISGVDVDTRSDIYSLGVLLYELLTSKTPFDAKELLAAGLDEMRRTIREKEPDRPSTKVSTLGGEELTTTAKRRGLDAPKLANTLRGDLDWIVMKCLEKDRARRYETANGLASDIQRHLRNEPVVACPPSRVYRFQKMVHRNKVAFVATTAIATALFLGLVISIWSLARERAARKRAVAAEKEQLHLLQQAQANEHKAKTEAEKKDQVVKFFETMLEGVGPSVSAGRDTTVLREILDAASARITAELTNQPEVEQYLRYTIGTVYQSIGQLDQAEVSLRLAIAAGKKVGSINYHLDNLFSISALGKVLMAQGRREEAEVCFGEILDGLQKLPPSSDRDVLNAAWLDQLGLDLRQQGRLSTAEPLILQSLEIRRKLSVTHPRALATSLNNVALLFEEKGNFDAAEKSFRDAIEIDDKLNLKDPDKLGTYYNLAVTLDHAGKLVEAEGLYRRCLEIAKKLIENRPETLLQHAGNISIYFYGLRSVLRGQGKLNQAEDCRREALKSLETFASPLAEVEAQKSPDLLSCRAEILARLGRWTEAARDLKKARQISRYEREGYWHNLTALLLQAGEWEAGRQYCTTEMERFRGTKDPNLAHYIALDCLILPLSGVDLAAAAEMAETACTHGTSSGKYTRYAFSRALAEYRCGHFGGAVEWMQKVLSEHMGLSPMPAYRTLPGDPRELEVAAYAVLSMAYHQLHRGADAHQALARSKQLAASKLGKPGEEDLSYLWTDWILANALLREAGELIERSAPGRVVQNYVLPVNSSETSEPTTSQSKSE